MKAYVALINPSNHDKTAIEVACTNERDAMETVESCHRRNAPGKYLGYVEIDLHKYDHFPDHDVEFRFWDGS